MERPRPSTVAWMVLAGGVIAYDLLCPVNETMSERFDDWLESPVSRTLAIGLTAITAAHLANVFDELNVPDPFSQGLKYLKELKRAV